ncbi:MAG: recombinase family protein [Solirubrobacterales bacterium]|nr:recombinase family protein [Solirubrobacterales bacterium]
MSGIMAKSGTQRAVGIIRVSQTNGREGESFASPKDQRDRIAAFCERDGLKLLQVYEELDVSGGKALAKRPGLGAAVAMVEEGRADVVVAAYFDRLFRSLPTQTEVIERVEQAGGQVVAVDLGQLTEASAGQWLNGTMMGAFSEYYRRSVAEKAGDAQRRAVARGVLPYPNVTPGYVRGHDGVLVVDPKLAPVVAEAFKMRARGATIKAVREYLAANGIERSYHGAHALLQSRVVLGEIHFGKLANLTAHPAIVDPDTWRQAQRASKSPKHLAAANRGRRPASDRLLARLGVLRCATCGARMVVGNTHTNKSGKSYPIYRCPPQNDCERRVTINAERVEAAVIEATKRAGEELAGRASSDDKARDAATVLEAAQEALDRALAGFAEAGVMAEPAAVQRLAELRQERDEAQEQCDQLRDIAAPELVVTVADFDSLTLDERRALVRSAIERVDVLPGSTGDRYRPVETRLHFTFR